MDNRLENSVHAGRMPSIDLFKTVSMLMVLTLHSLGSGGLFAGSVPGSGLYYLSMLLYAFCNIAVNCFALTTGFLNTGKRIKIKNILNLYLQVLFYSLAFFAVSCIAGDSELTLENLLPYAFPVINKVYWYFTCYFLTFAFMPLLNIILEHTEKRFLFIILAVIALLFGVVGHLAPYISLHDIFSLNNGFSPLWLIYLYLVGGAIRKYRIVREKREGGRACLIYILLYIISTLFSIASGCLRETLEKVYPSPPLVYEYNFIFNMLSAVFLLMFFLNLRIKANRVTSFFAKTSFGVYLIHEHPYVRKVLIEDALIPLLEPHPLVAMLGVLAFVLTVYLLCTVVEALRQLIFSLLWVNRLTALVDGKVARLLTKEHTTEK